MKEADNKLNLEETVSHYLKSLPTEESGANLAELQRFVRWFGRDKPILVLSQLQVDKYVASLSASDLGYAHKLDVIHGFLVYAKKMNWINPGVSLHARIKKEGGHTSAISSKKRRQPEVVMLTLEGYVAMQKELAELKERRPQVLVDIRRAAADKDFRENAPLHAAREQLGHIDGRIQELEATLKCASVVGQSEDSKNKVSLGNGVVLVDLVSGVESSFTLVGTKESAPSKGKISYVSPMGKAIMGRSCGDVVEVEAPSGKLSYRIARVGS
jgi:transcription elongation factor GreA